jgi:hypothetical protein
MEILKRAKSGGELVPFNADEKDVRDEVNRRTARAGLTTKNGEPIHHTKIIAQPPNDKYRKNYKRIFGHD